MTAPLRADRRIEAHLRDWRAGHVDGETLVIDVLASLRHFAETHAVDWDNANGIAQRHYAAEREPLTPETAAATATSLGRDLAALLDRMDAEGLTERGRSLIGDLLTEAGDNIDAAIAALADAEVTA